MPAPEPYIAIVTGDVVGSTNLPEPWRSRLPAGLRRLQGVLRLRYGPEVVSPLEIFQGDAWQFAVRRPELGPRAGVWLRAAAKAFFPVDPRKRARAAFDTRVAVGVGPVDRLDWGNLAESAGAAFALSGRALAKMGKRPRDPRLALRAEPAPEALDLLAGWLDAALTRLTVAQARVVAPSLLGLDQTEVATVLGVSQAAVSPGQSRSHLNLVLDTLDHLEYNLQKLYFENITSQGYIFEAAERGAVVAALAELARGTAADA